MFIKFWCLGKCSGAVRKFCSVVYYLLVDSRPLDHNSLHITSNCLTANNADKSHNFMRKRMTTVSSLRCCPLVSTFPLSTFYAQKLTLQKFRFIFQDCLLVSCILIQYYRLASYARLSGPMISSHLLLIKVFHQLFHDKLRGDLSNIFAFLIVFLLRSSQNIVISSSSPQSCKVSNSTK